MKYIHEHVKPFFHEGNDEACLLIHGFTGSPAKMRGLGEVLKNQGYTVKGILLKGHGTKVEDMRECNWSDWLYDAKSAYEDLNKKYKKVNVIGLSMGGILSLLLAQQYDVNKVVSISSPVKIFSRLAPFAFVLKYFKPYERWDKPKKQKNEHKENITGYDKVPVACIPSLLKLIRQTEKNLLKINCPTYIIQSYEDKVVKPISAQMIYDKISSAKKEILWLHKSPHACTMGPEKDTLYEKVISFLQG